MSKLLNKLRNLLKDNRGMGSVEVMFNGNKHHTAITVGGNGFIVGANPTTWP